MQKLELVTEAVGLSVTWDQKEGRELLVNSALSSLSDFQVNNAKSASSSCQHGRIFCPKKAGLGLRGVAPNSRGVLERRGIRW